MDKLITNIITYLQNTIPDDKVKHYFYGKPVKLSVEHLYRGVICVIPGETDITPVATGLRDEDTHSIRIIIAKNIKTEFYKNSSIQSAENMLVDIVDGRQADGSLKTDTVRYIIRNNMRNLGIVQTGFTITYNSEDSDYLGSATASIEIDQMDHQTQPV